MSRRKGLHFLVDWSEIALHASRGVTSTSRLAVLLGLSPAMVHARLVSDLGFAERWERSVEEGKVLMEQRLLDRLEVASMTGDVPATISLLKRIEKSDKDALSSVRPIAIEVEDEPLDVAIDVEGWERRSERRRLDVLAIADTEEGDGETAN